MRKLAGFTGEAVPDRAIISGGSMGAVGITSFLSGPLGPKSLWQGAFGLPRRRGWWTSARASSRVGPGQTPGVGAVGWGVVEGLVAVAGLGSCGFAFK